MFDNIYFEDPSHFDDVQLMDLDLAEIRPQPAEITIGGETYQLRKFDMNDEVWLQETFKGQKLFQNDMTTEQMCRIAFHQLSLEDKRKFKEIDAILFNEDTGEETPMKIGGWKLFREKISGPGEKLIVFKGLLHTLGISRPLLDKMLSDEEKKALMIEEEKAVKTPKKKRAGARS